MRETKFRGKTKEEEGKWVYGDLLQPINGKKFIWDRYVVDDFVDDVVEVIPETVGQFIGIKDAEGKEIYEGDIVRKTSIEYDYYGNEHKTEWLGVVKYIAPKFIYKGVDVVKYITPKLIYKGVDDFYLAGTAGFVVVGNIYENPELLF